MIDRLGRFHLNRSHQLASAIRRREHEIREYLQLTDFDGRALVVPDVRDDFVAGRAFLELDLQEPDYSIVFQLLANGTHQNRAHLTSGR
jgi:hypothetical protein